MLLLPDILSRSRVPPGAGTTASFLGRM